MPGEGRTLAERVATLESALGAALIADDAPNHSRWTCEACKTTLGWVNPKDGTVRCRVGLDAVYVSLGTGGKLTRVCPKCCEPNALKDEDVRAIRA